MRLFRKKTLTKMELVTNDHQAKATSYDCGWTTEIGAEFEKVFRGWDGRTQSYIKRLIIDKNHCVVFTQEGPVTGTYPFWLAIDQKGYPYPIAPSEHAVTYELAEEEAVGAN